MDIPIQAQILSLRAVVDSTLTADRDLTRQQPSLDARWAPGERMTARVEAALPGGRFHVRVDDLLLEMQLPDSFKAGDRVDLEFISAQPRPSFLLKDTPGSPLETQVALSRSGRQLDEIIKSVAPDRTSTPAPVRTAQPLLPGATAEAPKLAQALAQALTRSGLFYESHQAEWVLGQRLMDELLQEPQGRLSQILNRLAVNDAAAEDSGKPSAAAGDRSVSPSAAGSIPTADDVPARLDSKLPTTGVSTSGSGVTSPTTSTAPDAPRAADAVHPATTPQVRSQLDALDMRQMVWHGQLWPGQHLEWTIRDPGEDPGLGPEEAQPWFTGLRLRLPRLGEVVADLALVGPALRVRLAASEPQAQMAMSAGRVALADSLAQAGIDLASFKVAGSGGD